jgi:hypothetical protein
LVVAVETGKPENCAAYSLSCLSVRQIFNVSCDQPAERILEVPGFVTLKLALESSNEAHCISMSFDEMLALCKAAKKSVLPHSRNVPRLVQICAGPAMCNED